MALKNCIEIVREYLRVNGYDGLCNDECVCGIDKAPCGDGPYSRCQPAYRHSDGGYYPEKEWNEPIPKPTVAPQKQKDRDFRQEFDDMPEPESDESGYLYVKEGWIPGVLDALDQTRQERDQLRQTNQGLHEVQDMLTEERNRLRTEIANLTKCLEATATERDQLRQKLACKNEDCQNKKHSKQKTFKCPVCGSDVELSEYDDGGFCIGCERWISYDSICKGAK